MISLGASLPSVSGQTFEAVEALFRLAADPKAAADFLAEAKATLEQTQFEAAHVAADVEDAAAKLKDAQAAADDAAKTLAQAERVAKKSDADMESHRTNIAAVAAKVTERERVADDRERKLNQRERQLDAREASLADVRTGLDARAESLAKVTADLEAQREAHRQRVAKLKAIVE